MHDLSGLQPWLKALHLISMVAWFAGLFYMFRLFVYHAERQHQPDAAELMKYAAARLYRIIATPAMFATWAFGLSMLIVTPAFLAQGWLQIKLALLLGLTGYHIYVGRVRARFAADDLYLTSKQCRLRNEIPTLLLALIVFLAVLRPWV